MKSVDVIVVGAGAAGLMAGITAAERGAKVAILDSQTRIGAKILVAGGGRCNVTNEFVAPSRFNGGSERFVARVLRAFGLDDTRAFFESIGVPLKLEDSGKFFPVSNSGKTVLSALVASAAAAGAELIVGEAVRGITQGELWRVRTGSGTLQAKAVILCTGGLALPKSGSSGAGYPWLEALGHTIIPTTPALSPLLSDAAEHAALSGLTMPVRLTLRSGQDALVSCEGSFLFTHTGYSGPAALNLSRHVVRDRWERPGAQVYARFLPEVSAADEGAFWSDLLRSQGRKAAVNALAARLPRRAAEMISAHAWLAPGQPLGRLSREQSERLKASLLDQRLPVTSVAGYARAEATAGGACLDEIEPATMMSRIAPGLFLAGEICDVDGWLGGYNFQWAWSSGTVAGRSAAAYARRAQPGGHPGGAKA